MSFFNSIRKYKRITSFVLVLNICFQILLPTVSLSNNKISAKGTGTPVSASTSNMVDGYTGDFKYSVPLVNLPGPNGENVPINLNYHAGIKVNQSASWIGLGWDYNPGEISRQIVNAPDDYNGKLVNEMNKNIWKYGALYNNNLNNWPTTIGAPSYSNYKSGDTKTAFRGLTVGERKLMLDNGNLGSDLSMFDRDANSNYRFKRHISPHKSLAYDQYFVNGGLTGVIKPYYLGQVNIYTGEYDAQKYYNFSTGNKAAQFYFENSTRHNIDISPSSINSPDIVNQTTNQIHSGTRVKYFTNQEIRDNSKLFNNSTNTGFLDYKPTSNTTTDRRSLEDPSLIGAFQITDPSGVTYHYSLPVYAYEEMNYNSGNSGFYFQITKNRYASSWKLTAITGQDYQDSNNNYTVDEGDSGYWINYNYSLWTDDYFWSSQRYGYKTDFSIAQKFISYMAGSATGNRYSKLKSNSNGHTQSYYLNYIQTSTHTAFFIKSIRKDEQSYDVIKSPTNYPKPKALLKLDKIVLLRNENKNLLINATPLSTNDFDSRFNNNISTDNSYGIKNDQNFIHITKYKDKESDIKKYAIKIIDLETNYSLAKKYYGNINNQYIHITADDYYPGGSFGALYGDAVAWKNYSFASYSDELNSGKLTLKKINFYDLNGTKITPSIDFSYDETDPLKNPDFNQYKTDLWGYYKSDYINSHYVTNISKDDVDAWSLKEINTSLGGKIRIQYESDVYNQEGFAGEEPFSFLPCKFGNIGCNFNNSISVNTPHLIFPVKTFNVSSSGYNSLTFEDNDFWPYYYDVKPMCPQQSGYFSQSFSIYNYLEKCYKKAIGVEPILPITNPINYKYSIYQPPTVKLVRKGIIGPVFKNTTCPGSLAMPTIPTSYDGTLYYSSANSEQSILDGTGCTSSSTEKTSGYGVDFHVYFRSYLYGGGIRVKQIDVNDPTKSDVYTQKFTYGNGYCPVVPKPMSLSTSNGPSPYDLNMNTKSLIHSSANSNVGYDNMTTISINNSGENLGSIIQYFYNNIINPIEMGGGAISRTYLNMGSGQVSMNFAAGCNIGFYPGPFTYLDNVPFYNITINLKTNNYFSCQLGNLIRTSVFNTNSQEISSTTYNYFVNGIQERFNFGEISSDEYKIPKIKSVPPSYSNSSCKQTAYEAISRDYYNYNFSDSYNYNSYLWNTTTTTDGITITKSTLEMDPYTGAPTKVVINDPTQGKFETYTKYAYKNASLYPTFGLKTSNETNRNLLILTENNKTIKGGKYVINESKVNYSNNYPTRTFDNTTKKYKTTNIIKPWFRLNETYTRLLDDDILTSKVVTASDFRKTSTGTLYDSENNRIEEEGLNNRKTASKWGYNNHYKLADISNANYNSFTFSSFEDQINYTSSEIHFGGEITNGNYKCGNTTGVIDNIPTLIKPHTGIAMAKAPNNNFGPIFNTDNFEIGRTYVAKVWVHKSSSANASLSMSLSGSTNITKNIFKSDAANITVDDWTLMTLEITVPENFDLTQPHSLSVILGNFNGGGQNYPNAYFDDLSFHPKDAVITGNVYNNDNGLLIAQLDNENFATTYEYDNAGRITATYKEYIGGIKKVSTSTYHFAKP
jgi:YD repeat-containing protein